MYCSKLRWLIFVLLLISAEFVLATCRIEAEPPFGNISDEEPFCTKFTANSDCDNNGYWWEIDDGRNFVGNNETQCFYKAGMYKVILNNFYPITIKVGELCAKLTGFIEKEIRFPGKDIDLDIDICDPESDFEFNVQESVELTITSNDSNESECKDSMPTIRYDDKVVDKIQINDLPKGFASDKKSCDYGVNFTVKDINGLEVTSKNYAIPVQSRLRGYAVLIEGYNTSEYNPHRKTLDFVKKAFEEAGSSKYIHYFHNGEDSELIPTISNIGNIFDKLAREIEAEPAPFYLIMVGNSKRRRFSLNKGIDKDKDEVITPTTVKNWLDKIDSAYPQIVVVGSCYSGEFTEITRTNQVVITSTTDDNISYRGVNDGSKIRDGSFFVTELFRYFGGGYSLQDSFLGARKRTLIYTQNGGYGMQEPQLFQHEKLNLNKLYITENKLNNLDEPFITGTVYSAPNNSEKKEFSIKFITENSPEKVSLLARKVGNSASNANSEEQLEPSSILEPVTEHTDFNCENGEEICQKKISVDYFDDKEPGKYEIFYLIQYPKIPRYYSNEVPFTERSFVFISKENNEPPKQFKLLSPINGYTAAPTNLDFYWEYPTDPEGDSITYTLKVYDTSGNLIYQHEGLQKNEKSPSAPIVTVNFAEEYGKYSWEVEAVDFYGNRRLSKQNDKNRFTFGIDETNDDRPKEEIIKDGTSDGGIVEVDDNGDITEKSNVTNNDDATSLEVDPVISQEGAIETPYPTTIPTTKIETVSINAAEVKTLQPEWYKSTLELQPNGTYKGTAEKLDNTPSSVDAWYYPEDQILNQFPGSIGLPMKLITLSEPISIEPVRFEVTFKLTQQPSNQ